MTDAEMFQSMWELVKTGNGMSVAIAMLVVGWRFWRVFRPYLVKHLLLREREVLAREGEVATHKKHVEVGEKMSTEVQKLGDTLKELNTTVGKAISKNGVPTSR